MIYILTRETWPFNPDWSDRRSLFQYVNLEYFIKNFLFPDTPSKTHILNYDDNALPNDTVEKLLQENTDIKIFACDLDCFGPESKRSLLSYDEYLCNKYPDVFFIFFYHELDLTFLLDNSAKKLKNVIYVLNSFNTNEPDELNTKVFPYYLINSYLQKNYDAMFDLYKQMYQLRKYKKYNFLNGIHKPHRYAAYKLIKKHNLLDDGFFSYLDYTNFTKQESHLKQTADFLNMSVDELKNELSTVEIPYLLETFESYDQPGIFATPFLIPPIYSWQSYISITSETNYIEMSNIVSLSEKSFKAFAGFNIPLIYGQPSITDYLKNLGFDMFDDLFDNTTVNSKVETFEKLDRNLQVIKNMSLEELHKFYVNNFDRIFYNFELMTKQMKDRHFKQIHNNVKSLFDK
jgi:hypothetical protein